MDAKTCLQKLHYIGVLAFATVDGYGAPQIRNISAIHYEPEAMYFFTAKGKSFCKELLSDGRIQVLGYTKYKEMIRLSARAIPAPEADQKKFGVNPIFRESYSIGSGHITFKGYQISQSCIGCGTCLKNCPQRCIEQGNPYQIKQAHCLHCGNCYEVCPIKAVEKRG